MTSVYQSAAGSFFVHLSLKISQPLKRLKDITSLCQLKALRGPFRTPYSCLRHCFLSSHARLRCHPLWNRAAQMPWNTSESPNRSVTKSTLWRSSGLLNQIDTRTHTHPNENYWKARDCELYQRADARSSLNSSQKLLIKLSAWCPTPFANPTEDRID